MDLKKYESIRPLAPEEVQEAIQFLTSLEPLRAIYESLHLDQSWDELMQVLATCRCVEDFKLKVSSRWVKHIMHQCCSSVELTGMEHIAKEEAYTYISNHRDIILDSAFLNVLLADRGAKFPEIAIGDNLMLYPWIEILVKLNGSFLVRRNLQGREVLLAARLLSEYMHDAIAEDKSLWIAQREGRSKDSTDKTQPALLKMLALGAKSRHPLEALTPLRIVPVTCSYEYDPCDYLKAQEMQHKRDIEGFKKSPADDGINMRTGLFGWKGRVSFHIGRPLNELIASSDSKSEAYDTPEAIAARIDKEIHSNYKLYPINYIALDQLEGKKLGLYNYTAEEEAKTFEYIESRIDLVELQDGLTPDRAFLRQCLLTMYANPVRSLLQAKGEGIESFIG